MARPSDFAKVHLDAGEEPLPAPAVTDDETPFRILVLGDFSGRANRGVRQPRDIAERRVVSVDRDNFDGVLRRLAPSLRLNVNTEQEPLLIEIADIDHFEPDSLYRRLPLFRALREALDEPPPAPVKPPPPPSPPAAADVGDMLSGSLLDSIVEGGAEASAAGARRSLDPFQAYLQKLVEPHLEPKADPGQIKWRARVEQEIGDIMRTVLHHPDFQSLEAAWRGLFFLVRTVETGPNLKIHILDVSLDELMEDLLSTDNLRATGMYKILVEQTVRTPGAAPWAVMAGMFDFTSDVLGANILARMALLASQAGAPFLAGARLPWPETADESWGVVRAMPEASFTGLAAPRFLLRLPYGRETVPVDAFEFEEMPADSVHEHYLWGCPSLFCAALLAESFSSEGWNMSPGSVQEMHGFPLHNYRHDDEAMMKPPSEYWMTEERLNRMLDAGLMVLVSYKNSDRIRLARFQSIQNPPLRLGGRW